MRKRSKYRPIAVITDPLSLMRPASKDQREKLMARFRSALETIARGAHPTPDEWRDLSDAVNTVETLALNLGKLKREEVQPMLDAATVGMVQAATRYKAGQALRLDAAGIKALWDVLDVYDQCLEGLTEREMAQAHAETQRRVNEILRQKANTHEVVAI